MGRGATLQMAFSAPCICANTVVAPNTMAPNPAMVGSRPLCSMRLFSTAVCTAAAAPAPMADSSCSAISPCAARSPSTRPTTLTATITTGATENTVKKASAAACTNTCASSHTRSVVRATLIQYRIQSLMHPFPQIGSLPSLGRRNLGRASLAPSVPRASLSKFLAFPEAQFSNRQHPDSPHWHRSPGLIPDETQPRSRMP
ncbi:protein of unknown function [Thauera humireducens]|nr:protein of unknown function [Thauera humireducens]